jgi:hypothetical protein
VQKFTHKYFYSGWSLINVHVIYSTVLCQFYLTSSEILYLVLTFQTLLGWVHLNKKNWTGRICHQTKLLLVNMNFQYHKIFLNERFEPVIFSMFYKLLLEWIRASEKANHAQANIVKIFGWEKVDKHTHATFFMYVYQHCFMPPVIFLCVGSKPGLLRIWHWQPDAL